MITLTKRQKDIMGYLLTNKSYSTIKNMASIFEVSERTIRYDLDVIEAWLRERNVGLIRKPRLGISIELEDSNVNKILDELTNIENIDYSMDERQYYLKLNLFLAPNYITLEELSKIVKVSKNTVVSDLDILEEELKEGNFSIERKTYYGIRVKGKESYLRRQIIELIQQGLSKGLLNIDQLKILLNGIEYDVLLETINYKEELLGLSYTEESTRELILNLAVNTKRIIDGRNIEYIYIKDDYKKDKYFETTQKCLGVIEKAYDIEFSQNEIYYLDKIFKGAKIREFIRLEKVHENKNVNIIVEEVIEDVKRYLGINLEDDIEFINGLKTHLQIAIYRLNNNLGIENPLTDQIKYRYPFIFEMSRKILSKHNETLGGKLIDDEIAYVAMHIGAAFERNKSSSFMPNVLLVCGSGLATSNLLKTRLNIMLPELRYIGPVSRTEANKYIESNEVDFIITTSPLDIQGVKTIKINPLLDNEDLSKLKTLIFKNTIRKQVSHISNMNEGNEEKKLYHFYELFKREEVIFKADCNDWRKAIHLASKPLLKNHSIDNDYVEAMISAVEELGPYMVFIPEVALTHAASQNGVLKDGMSLLTLKESIKFGDKGKEQVRIIIVLASLDPETYINKLVKLVEILEKKSIIEKIIEADKFEDIMNLTN